MPFDTKLKLPSSSSSNVKDEEMIYYKSGPPSGLGGFDLKSLRQSLEDAERTAQESLSARARGGTIISSKSTIQ